MQHNSKTISLKHALKKKAKINSFEFINQINVFFRPPPFFLGVQTFALLEVFVWKLNDSIEIFLQDIKRNLKNLQISSDFYTWFK
jgi:hypothetical protein